MMVPGDSGKVRVNIDISGKGSRNIFWTDGKKRGTRPLIGYFSTVKLP